MQRAFEELLETIWTLREEGEKKIQYVLEATQEAHPHKLLEAMEREGLIRLSGGEVILQEKGEKKAESLIRRHRLAERLLFDLFQLEDAEIESTACEFEHILSPEVTDSVCTFLGHPPVCPHGKPIPKGPCCAKFQKEIRPLVMRLCDLEAGESGRIVYITTRHRTRLDRLSALGVMPGNVIRLHQKRPSFIVQVDETLIAIDREISEEIYVKRL